MIEFKKILCPIDVEDGAFYQLEYARELARGRGATLYLLNVARIPTADMVVPVAIARNPPWEQAARNSLEQIAQQCLAGAVRYEIMVRQGIPESAILEVAAELPADLIVMGTHSRTGLARFLLGDLAEDTTDEAPCPVLVVPRPAGSKPSSLPPQKA